MATNFTIKVYPTHISFLGDVLARMNVLHPNISFQECNDEIIVSGANTDDEAEIRQSVADQFLRTRYSEATSQLRYRLFKRLLS